MDEVAEYGIAAHALYKDGGTDPSRLASESRAYQWLRRTDRSPRRGRQSGGVPRAYEARAVPRPGLLLHAEGPAHRAAARRDADRLRLCGPHRRRQHRGRLQDQRPHGAAPDRARRTATRSRSSAPTGRRRRRPGNRSSSPARRAPRSGARRAPPCGGNMPASAARSSSAPSSAPARRFSDEKLKAALPRLARASVDDVLAAVGRGEMFSGDVVQGGLSRLQGRAGARAAPRRTAAAQPAPGDRRVKIKLPRRRQRPGRHPDPRPRRGPAGALRPERRRRARAIASSAS